MKELCLQLNNIHLGATERCFVTQFYIKYAAIISLPYTNPSRSSAWFSELSVLCSLQGAAQLIIDKQNDAELSVIPGGKLQYGNFKWQLLSPFS